MLSAVSDRCRESPAAARGRQKFRREQFSQIASELINQHAETTAADGLDIEIPGRLISPASFASGNANIFKVQHPRGFEIRNGALDVSPSVFCVRIAPTQTSNGDSPGHQCWCPDRSRMSS